MLSAVSWITGGLSFSQHSRQLLLFISSVVYVPLNVPTDFRVVERGTGRNEHGVVVEWISARVCGV